jgi:hypothetical protein
MGTLLLLVGPLLLLGAAAYALNKWTFSAFSVSFGAGVMLLGLDFLVQGLVILLDTPELPDIGLAGLGAAILLFGVAALLKISPLLGVLIMLFGVAGIVSAVLDSRGQWKLSTVAFSTGGVIGILLGFLALFGVGAKDLPWLSAVGMVLGGIAILMFLPADLLGRPRLIGLAFLALGLEGLLFGVANWRGPQTLSPGIPISLAVWPLGGGIALMLAGVAALLERLSLGAAAVLVMGSWSIFLAVVALNDRSTLRLGGTFTVGVLSGVVLFMVGLVGVGIGFIALYRPALPRKVVTWLAKRDNATDIATDGNGDLDA